MIKIDAGLGEYFRRIIINTKERGVISEEKTNRALERLKRRSQIVDCMQVSAIKGLDSKKVDFIIVAIKGACHTILPLQVKSSGVGLNEYRRAMKQIERKEIKNMFKNIPVIIVNERDSIEDLCGKILNVIS